MRGEGAWIGVGAALNARGCLERRPDVREGVECEMWGVEVGCGGECGGQGMGAGAQEGSWKGVGGGRDMQSG
eukprot:200828-Chlamydomonas_euryale.AAC.1